jgi:hypothetical protein
VALCLDIIAMTSKHGKTPQQEVIHITIISHTSSGIQGGLHSGVDALIMGRIGYLSFQFIVYLVCHACGISTDMK